MGVVKVFGLLTLCMIVNGEITKLFNKTTITPKPAIATTATLGVETVSNEMELLCSGTNATCTTGQLDNITTAEIENVTLITTSPASNLFITAPSTTPVPKLSKELQEMGTFMTCACDLQYGVCEINCCCDKDCSFENKMVFSHCEKDDDRYRDTRFCKYMDYIYKNNTPYEWEVNQNGLFCIIKSNLPPQYTVHEKQILNSIEDAIFQQKNKYSWPDLHTSDTLLRYNSSENFVYGKQVWIIKNGQLQEFRLPSSSVTSMCNNKRNIMFLQNIKTKCIQFLLDERNSMLNAAEYFENVYVIAAPALLNITSIKLNFQRDCPRNICIPIEVKTCDNDFENCKNVTHGSIKKVSCHYSLFKNENQCFSLMQKLRYNFYHNGTKGISRVELFLVLKNLSYGLQDDKFAFTQEFSVDFLWTNYRINYSSILSGNPGYRIGKYILIGKLVSLLNITNITGTNITKAEVHYKIRRNFHNVAENFLIFPYNEWGYCKLNNNSYVPVEFGYNMVLKCKINGSLNITKQNTALNVCQSIQKLIFKFWSVNYTNVTNVTGTVGQYGNANANVPSDWVKILYDQNPEHTLNSTHGILQKETIICKNITNSLSIGIFHSRVDTKHYQNQEIIKATTFKFGTVGQKFEFKINKSILNYELTTHVDVTFFDITKPKIKKFVDPPSLKIKLPYDFFYPFIKVENKASFVRLRPYVSFFLLAVLIF